MNEWADQVEWTPELGDEVDAWLHGLSNIRAAYTGPKAGLVVFVGSMQRVLGQSYPKLKEKVWLIDAAVGALGVALNPGETLEKYCARLGEPAQLRRAMNDAAGFLQKEYLRATHRVRRGLRLPASAYSFNELTTKGA